MRWSECESEFEINAIESNFESRQFMAGSLDSPVSTAKI